MITFFRTRAWRFIPIDDTARGNLIACFVCIDRGIFSAHCSAFRGGFISHATTKTGGMVQKVYSLLSMVCSQAGAGSFLPKAR